ncbi:MAG: fumarylacetoacetate hydrolase family protein [Porticoccaceae bacterium]|nr:fumarylacetoacetate hydrolase family protein [Porticoccaceae bacterium]
MCQYQHILDGKVVHLPLGKVVCVGRNYAAHARELNNPLPTSPVLFIKPSTSLVTMNETFSIPSALGECHFEAEMSVLMGKQLSNCNEQEAQEAIAGVGISLDLTLRDVQQNLKEKGLPWEKAKAFDGACPTSAFVSKNSVGDLQNKQIRLFKNDELHQDGNTAEMLNPVLSLISYISRFFTLLPGDLVLTGTPAGVGPLQIGDSLVVELVDFIRCKTEVVSR